MIEIAASNAGDCESFGLHPTQFSPWNWSSNWVVERARLRPRDRVLDLGCRDNPWVLSGIAKAGAFGVLVDIVPPGPETQYDGSVFVSWDLREQLPFPDASFEVVLSESTLEHLPIEERDQCFREAMRVLRPGGHLCVTVGVPLGFDDDAATRKTLETHPFFTERWCPIYTPVDIVRIVEAIGGGETTGLPTFPGRAGFHDDDILGQPGIIVDDFKDHPDVPDIAKLRSVKTVEVGICLTKGC